MDGERELILAPLRGVTIRTFREVFAPVIAAAGFTEVVTPFIAAVGGYDPLRDRELKAAPTAAPFAVVPQFIGKDPVALKRALVAVRGAGWSRADLNCGCPYPMVRNKGRGAGLLKDADGLRRMLAAGCEAMGPGCFSVKVRLGVERPDELSARMAVFNEFPLRRLVVHARTARQMYSGACDRAAFAEIVRLAKMPVVYNGEVSFPPPPGSEPLMIGRAFIRALGEREDIGGLLARYVDASVGELSGPSPVLGRMKELIAYWRFSPRWHRRWQVIKLTRTLEEFHAAVRL